MAAPTQQQVKNVQTNVKNMMSWANHLHSYLQDIINETYDYISLPADKDPGQTFVDDLIYGMLTGGIGRIPGLGILGGFLGGMFHTYVTAPPPSLQGVLAGVWDRFDKSFLQANTDLALIYNDVAGNWTKTYTNPTNGTKISVSAWGDAGDLVPSPTSNDYQTMTNDAVAAYKVNLAKVLLRDKYQVISDPQGVFEPGKSDAEAITFIQSWEKSNPAYYMQAGHDEGGSPICPQKGYTYVEPFLGYGSSDPMFAHHMPTETCNWLMRDDGWGKTTNVDGLATRAEVFCEWGLKCSMDINKVGKIAAHGYDIPDGCIGQDGFAKPAPEMSEEELALNLKHAELWHLKFADTPRVDLEQAIIDKALKDSGFYYELIKRPKKTVEELLGWEFPEHVEFEVIVERGGEYKMVVPWAGRQQRRKSGHDHWLVRVAKWIVGQDW